MVTRFKPSKRTCSEYSYWWCSPRICDSLSTRDYTPVTLTAVPKSIFRGAGGPRAGRELGWRQRPPLSIRSTAPRRLLPRPGATPTSAGPAPGHNLPHLPEGCCSAWPPARVPGLLAHDSVLIERLTFLFKRDFMPHFSGSAAGGQKGSVHTAPLGALPTSDIPLPPRPAPAED